MLEIILIINNYVFNKHFIFSFSMIFILIFYQRNLHTNSNTNAFK